MAKKLSGAALTIVLLVSACSSNGGGTGGASLTSSPENVNRSVTRDAGLAAALPSTGTLPAPASAWPAAGYDARHSSGTSATGPQTGDVRWARDLGGDATPGPVIGADGSILAATNSGVLHALNPDTGKDVWTYDGGGGYGSDLSTSPAVVAGGTILWPGPSNTLFALSKAGKLLWRESFDGQVLSPAIAGDHRVYVADMAGHLVALEVTGSSHRKLWTLDTGGVDYGSPTVAPNGTIYTVSDKDLVGVRDLGAKGRVLFRFHTEKMIEVSNGVSADGTVILGTNNDRQFGVSSTGAADWALNIDDYSYSSSVVRDGRAYFGDNSGRLWVIDAKTGKVEHSIAPLGAHKEHIWTSAAVDAKGNFYWGSGKGSIYGYNAAGKQLFQVKTGSGINSYPAIGGDGTLYIGNTAGKLYAIGS